MRWNAKLLGTLATALIALSGCCTMGSNCAAPQAPTVGPAFSNAHIWPHEPLTVYFSDHGTVTESQQTVAMSDIAFANRYAFQIQLGHRLGSTGLDVQESGVSLPLLPARTNTKSRPSKINPQTGQVLEWDWPLPANMVPRGQPPQDKSSYSLQLVNTCAGQLDPSGHACASPGAVLLLEISPPVVPAPPTQGQTFEYTLIEKGQGKQAGTVAKTVIKAIYITPNQCVIRNLLMQPSTGKAGEVGTADFETTDCRRVALKVGNDVLYDRVAPTFADNVMDSRRFGLPKQTSITATVTASDSMGRGPQPRTGRIQIDPCSISPTHPQCPVNCTANPNDSRCPANCTATPNDPRCQTACPRTTDNPTGEYKSWDTGMYCGSFQTIPVQIQGCTFAQAQQAFPPNAGCVYTTITGTPVGECSSGAPKQDFDMCLSCTPAGGSSATLEYAQIKNACSFDQAKSDAIAARQPRSCTFVQMGTCP